MELELLNERFSVCKLREPRDAENLPRFFSLTVTDREVSLLCREEDAPGCALGREDGWRALRVRGTLDFSLTGVLAGLADILAAAGVGIFAVSTYDTDYILLKEEQLGKARRALEEGGYAFV